MNFQRTLDNHIICGKCQTENPSDAVYCRHCGLLFTKKPAKKKSSKQWLWLLLLIPVLGLAVYAAVWYALQPSYLYIDGETLSSLEVEPTGGTSVLTISTDADDYYVYTPSWVTAEKGFGVLTLSYDSNESGISRTGTVRLSAGDLESQVVLTQEPNTEPVATIEKIWCVHDVYQYGQKGMEIHVKFHVKRMLGRTGRCVAYFYQSDNTTPLYDYNGNYTTSDGQVSCGSDYMPSYEESVFKDFTLFMPLDELHLSAGEFDLTFDVAVYDDNGNLLCQQEGEKFTFTKGY